MKLVTRSWPGMFVIGGSTLLSWLAATPASFRADRSAPVSTTLARANKSIEFPPIVRLQDWRPRPVTTARAGRDIFAFKTPRGKSPAPHPEPVYPAPAAPASPLPMPFKLIGMAHDADEEPEAATAIISGQGQVYLVKQGEVVAGTYTVGPVSADSVELIDLAKGGNLRLVMK